MKYWPSSFVFLTEILNCKKMMMRLGVVNTIKPWAQGSKSMPGGHVCGCRHLNQRVKAEGGKIWKNLIASRVMLRAHQARRGFNAQLIGSINSIHPATPLARSIRSGGRGRSPSPSIHPSWCCSALDRCIQPHLSARPDRRVGKP